MASPARNGLPLLRKPTGRSRAHKGNRRLGRKDWRRTTAAVRVDGWGQADAVLAELGRVEARLQAIERRRAEALARAEAAAARAAGELGERRQRLERALERFCRRHGAELQRVNGHGRRSRRLLFGRVGLRASQAVVVRSEATALRALAHWRAGQQFLRLRTELDREALRRFLLRGGQASAGLQAVAGRLRRVGVKLERRESWFYELDADAIERWG